MKYSFCPKCGQSLRYQQIDEQTALVCQNQNCGFIFWQSSKPTVCVMIPNDMGQLLMTTRAIEPEKGKLDLPGGFLLDGEHPHDSARREIKEELGVDIMITGQAECDIDRYGHDGDYTLNIGIVAEITGGTLSPSDELTAIEWLNPKDINRAQLAFTNNAYFMDWWLKHHS